MRSSTTATATTACLLVCWLFLVLPSYTLSFSFVLSQAALKVRPTNNNNRATSSYVKEERVVSSSQSLIAEQPQQQKQRRRLAFLSKRNHNKQQQDEVDRAAHSHGMPWKTSIDPAYTEEQLFYMPFFEWQIKFMKENLTNLRVLPTTSRDGREDLTYVSNDDNSGKPVRMITLCFASDEYRKIRLTVYDAGYRTQVFTSLWYPQPMYDLPVLGTDLLQFNKQKHLCVVDFQPIGKSSCEVDHAAPYEHLLKPIRDQYPSLQESMTKRFYDENQFFSKQMLLGRFANNNDSDDDNSEQQHPVFRDLMPAYQEYVKAHVNLLKSCTPNPKSESKVLRQQMDYDTYSAKRDPAHAMFTRVFGKKIADDFVYDVLFSLSDRNSSSS